MTAAIIRSRSGCEASITCRMQVGVGGLLERGAEGGHQRVRQPIDEANRVRHEQLALIGQAHAAHQRIERDEERVGQPAHRHAVSRLKSVVLPALV